MHTRYYSIKHFSTIQYFQISTSSRIGNSVASDTRLCLTLEPIIWVFFPLPRSLVGRTYRSLFGLREASRNIIAVGTPRIAGDLTGERRFVLSVSFNSLIQFSAEDNTGVLYRQSGLCAIERVNNTNMKRIIHRV